MPDAGADSQQTIASGNVSFEFTATETDKLRFAGLSNGNPGVSGTEIDFHRVWNDVSGSDS